MKSKSKTVAERKSALAEGLGIDLGEIESTRNDEFKTPDGTYLVLTEREAHDNAIKNIESTVEENGLESFTEEFIEKIIDDYTDKDRLLKLATDDILESQVEYLGKVPLIGELLERGLVLDSDLKDNGDLKPEIDLDEKKRELAEVILDEMGIYEWLDELGSYDGQYEFLVDNDLVDWNEVYEAYLRDIGVPSLLATYDDKEIELEGGLRAYRIA